MDSAVLRNRLRFSLTLAIQVAKTFLKPGARSFCQPQLTTRFWQDKNSEDNQNKNLLCIFPLPKLCHRRNLALESYSWKFWLVLFSKLLIFQIMFMFLILADWDPHKLPACMGSFLMVIQVPTWHRLTLLIDLYALVRLSSSDLLQWTKQLLTRIIHNLCIVLNYSQRDGCYCLSWFAIWSQIVDVIQ